MPPYYLGLDFEVVKEFLPLGDSLVGGGVTLIASCVTYFLGRKRQRQEIENLQAEKKSIEAASGVSTAEAAQIISEAAAATVQPLTERIREQREEMKYLTSVIVDLRHELERTNDQKAHLATENELMRRKFALQGESIPELPTE